jgi:hypothetical protein
MAYVATLRLESAMSASSSTLQVATLSGYVAANAARVRVEANLRVVLGDDRNC